MSPHLKKPKDHVDRIHREEINKTIEHVRSQVQWINKNLEATEDWLKEQETFYRATDYRGS